MISRVVLPMNNVSIFWLQLVSSCVVSAAIVAWWVWPSLIKLPRNSALIPLIFVHVFRYVGMTLLVTGMVDPRLPRQFLDNAAYGDLVTAGAGARFYLCSTQQVEYCHSSGMGVQHLGICRFAERSAGSPAVERAELQPGYLLVCLHVLRSRGTCFTFVNLLDIGQVQVLEGITFRIRWG